MRKVLLVLAVLASPAKSSVLFDDHSTLEVTLSGPLSSVIADKRNREQRPFSLSIAGEVFHVQLRVRGNSRVKACPFPPLRLNFKKGDLEGTSLQGEDKLKLVTHCRNGNNKSQDSVLNEYAAYRAFQAMSPYSYRVRLLKIRYEDTDGKQSKLDEPHFGFLIESDEGLARRLGGGVEKPEAIVFSDLLADQTARLSLFQYFIGNADWSFVAADGDDACCHNVDLLRVDGKLLPIPYDFDLAVITRSRYRMGNRMNVSTRRKYSGYCRLPEDRLENAIGELQAKQDAVMAVMHEVPAIAESARERRVSFAADYFAEAANRNGLLAKLTRDCVGSR